MKNKKIILPPGLRKKTVLAEIFFCLFAVFSVTALFNPKWGTEYVQEEFKRGLDTVFAIDISRSMDIKDVQIGGTPASRLERGLYIAREGTLSALSGRAFSERVQGVRFAAAIGRGRGYLSIPLTYDSDAAIKFLETLDSAAMTGRSTNLQSLIEASLEAFQATSAARKVIVLISDGESHLGVMRNALNVCVKEGVIIIAVCIGSDEGSPVQGIAGGFNNSTADDLVPVSKRDTAVMRTAAERTGGIYIDGNREDAAGILRNQLLSLASGNTGINENAENTAGIPAERKTEPKQRRGLFAVLAILAYGASVFIPRMSRNTRENKRGQKNNQRQGKLTGTASVIVFVFLLSSCTEGRLLLIEANYLFSRGRYNEAAVPYHKALEYEDTAPYAEYGLGLTYHFTDESAMALNRYAKSHSLISGVAGEEHRELRYRIHYNTGILYFEEGDYEAAANEFKEALKIDHTKIDAKRNLEISLMSVTKDTSRDNRQETQNENRDAIFEYARQQEQPFWKSGEWQADEAFDGPDY